MKVNLLETHDRFEHFRQQNFSTDEFLKKIIESKPFGDYPYYLFQHCRQTDSTLDQRSIWQPRLGKPTPQLNSTLVRVRPFSKDFDVIWVIPPVEIWSEFDKGKVHENEVIQISTYMFQKRFLALCQPIEGDVPPEDFNEVMFEFYPLIFNRETLPDDKKSLWDKAKAEKEQQGKK